MKKKKGFTLVELLAVIVILAVVSIIVIPIVINIIENARKGSLKDSAYGLMESADMYYTKNMKNKKFEEDGYVDFVIENSVQTSDDKLDYKGKVNNAYLRLTVQKGMALCVDDGKYYAVKNLDNEVIEVDEGMCSNEYDDELMGYVPIGGANFVGTRFNIKAYASKNSLPSKANDGYIGVITDKNIKGFYVSPTTPPEPKEGMVWVVTNNESDNYIYTNTSKTGVSYILQYYDNKWNLKDSYVYNDKKWNQLKSYDKTEYQQDFDYKGQYEEFIAPYDGYYTVELWGAAGGDYNSTYHGGKGAYTKGDLYLKKDETIYVYVGGKGTNSTAGWNGGGTSFKTGNGGGGGGSTDVRTVPTSARNVWRENDSLRTRIMVAAGAGGGEYWSSGENGSGGSGGGLIGYRAAGLQHSEEGSGGTQISGGYAESNGSTWGGFGYGGNGHTSYGASGGGGWYGGGGDGETAGGGGGSSYISGHEGCVSVDSSLYVNGGSVSYTGKYFLNTLMIDGQGYKWTNKKVEYEGMPAYKNSGTMDGNSAEGHARITFSHFDSLTEEQHEQIGVSLQNIWLYDYMGYYQKFVAPKAGTYKVELWGASGGTYDSSRTGGKGAYTKGEITLKKGTTLYIYVGNQGTTSAAGWNGGGTSFKTGNGGGGGGATDIRTVPTTLLNEWKTIDSLKTRIMVAGAGGGGEYWTGSEYGSGGAAGGLEGYRASALQHPEEGSGGTQVSGGSAQSNVSMTIGSFGQGGNGHTSYGASGGGGWYGGGGDGETGGGGGGSSYISGHAGCIAVDDTAAPLTNTYTKIEDSISYTKYKFTNTVMIDGQGYSWTTQKSSSVVKMPTHDNETTMIGNQGNGYAKITFIK